MSESDCNSASRKELPVAAGRAGCPGNFALSPDDRDVETGAAAGGAQTFERIGEERPAGDRFELFGESAAEAQAASRCGDHGVHCGGRDETSVQQARGPVHIEPRTVRLRPS